MKRSGLGVLALLAITTMALPPGSAFGADTAAGETESAEQEPTGKQWSETLETLKSYSSEQRDKALAAGKKTLDAMDERIEKLESWTSEHWDSLSKESREKKTRLLNTMREQRRKVAEWYGGMKHSSSEAWESVKQGFIRSYDKLQSAYGDAVESFREEEESGSSSN